MTVLVTVDGVVRCVWMVGGWVREGGIGGVREVAADRGVLRCADRRGELDGEGLR